MKPQLTGWLEQTAVGSSATKSSVLTIRGLTKKYRTRSVLRDLDLEVFPGELVGIEGENGSGKSTLLKCLTGLVRPTSGTVEIAGSLGYCPQEPVLIPTLTAREFLLLTGAAYRLPAAEISQRTEVLMKRYGAAQFLDTRIDRMSGGTAQKVNLIAALQNEPNVILLDEPYQGFDYETHQTFWNDAELLRDSGCAVVVVSHMHTERGRFDRVLVLRDGRLARENHR
jgi:ABC-2 type transport system ATP-binding protein